MKWNNAQEEFRGLARREDGRDSEGSLKLGPPRGVLRQHSTSAPRACPAACRRRGRRKHAWQRACTRACLRRMISEHAHVCPSCVAQLYALGFVWSVSERDRDVRWPVGRARTVPHVESASAPRSGAYGDASLRLREARTLISLLVSDGSCLNQGGFLRRILSTTDWHP